MYDVIIIGGGGAGLSAGLYNCRAQLNTILIEKQSTGGQIAITSEVENYPGFPEGILGPDLAKRMEEQAVKFGLKIDYGLINKIIPGENDSYIVESSDGKKWEAPAVIIASGADPRRLGIPGENEFIGKGVSYCGTCDAPFFRGRNVAVVGGGDAAVEEAMYIAGFAAQVTIVHRRDKLRATPIIQERAFAAENISFKWDAVCTEIKGKDFVESVSLENLKTNEKEDMPVDGVFIFIGHVPNTSFFRG